MDTMIDYIRQNLHSLSEAQLTALSDLITKTRREEETERRSAEGTHACISCGSTNIIKHGTTSKGSQRFRCKDCGKTFTETSGTPIEHARVTDTDLRRMIARFIDNKSLRQISKEVGFSRTTVMLYKHKLCTALAQIFLDQDTFNSITECDEVYTNVSFKGKKDLHFFIYELHRLPRHHRTYEETKVYLEKHGIYLPDDELNELFNQRDVRKRGISNEKVCIITCKDRDGSLYISPVCVGRLEVADTIEHLKDRIDKNAILVTDEHQAYKAFAESELLYLKQIPSEKHADGPYNLAQVNALHSNIRKYYSESKENLPATKYLAIGLMLFWWLQKNDSQSKTEQISALFEILTTSRGLTGLRRIDIQNKKLTINVKKQFPVNV